VFDDEQVEIGERKAAFREYPKAGKGRRCLTSEGSLKDRRDVPP
jgi:hypothetical protein